MDIKKQEYSKATKYRWTITSLLFFALTINYLDRQVLSLTWTDFIAPEFHWTNNDYGTIAGVFSLVYAIAMLFAGKIVDWLDTKKGFSIAILIWSVGAVLHAFAGIATSGVLTGHWLVSFAGAKAHIATVQDISRVVNISVVFFIFGRIILAIGESGNFPASIKATAEYFPKKDRAFSTSIFNAGAAVGALLAPVSIPFVARAFGWEMAFILIGALGFVWLIFWHYMYKKPHLNPKVNQAELAYIHQDDALEKQEESGPTGVPYLRALTYKQTWAFAVGKFLTDGVWWFYLFWAPAYLKAVYGLSTTDSAPFLFVLYLITLLSIIGGWMPTYYVDKKGMNPYAGRMRAMLIFAFFPLLALLAQPLGETSVWFPVIIIGIAAAAHQAWSANIFTTVSDMFPKKAVATITGIGGMAGGVGGFLINKGSGMLFDYSEKTGMKLMGFEGIDAGYFIIFIICALAYLLAWIIMKSLVPSYKVITDL